MQATQIIAFVVTLAQSIIIALTSAGMDPDLRSLQSLLDFVLSWVSVGFICVLVMLQRGRYFSEPLNVVDFVTMSCHLLDLAICLGRGETLIHNESDLSVILRSLKVFRLIRILYLSDSVFVYEKYVIQVFKQTIMKVKAFLLLCLCFAIMFKQVGELLFAFKVRFNSQGESDPAG